MDNQEELVVTNKTTLRDQNIKLLINRLRDKMYPAQMLEVPSDLRQVPAYFENPNCLLGNFTTRSVLNGHKTKPKTKVIA